MGEQLCFFEESEIDICLTEAAILNHKHRMQQQARSKTGALARIAKSRQDDRIAEQIAGENLRMKEEIAMLRKLVSRSA